MLQVYIKLEWFNSRPLVNELNEKQIYEYYSHATLKTGFSAKMGR